MIYLDHAAATPIDHDVAKKMRPFMISYFGNPSSLYQFGVQGRQAIDKARQTVATVLHAQPAEVFFTGSGTEANNWALFGAANASAKKHIISTPIEHHSVMHPLLELERRGCQVTYLKVNRDGLIDLKDLQKAVTKDTFLVSIMYGQNEIGTVENLPAIGAYLRSKSILFHSDACQAAGLLPLDVHKLGVDMLTLNSGKIYGPKGVGALYIRKGVKITPFIYGGGQEHRLRGGTENVMGIVGFAAALEKAEKMRAKEAPRLKALRDKLIKGILNAVPRSYLNGHPTQRLPHNINISFEGVDAESLLLKLDMAGICASAGSACTSGTLQPSHVLVGIGLSKALAKGSIRFTLGRKNTPKDIQKVLKILPPLIHELRRLSRPKW